MMTIVKVHTVEWCSHWGHWCSLASSNCHWSGKLQRHPFSRPPGKHFYMFNQICHCTVQHLLLVWALMRHFIQNISTSMHMSSIPYEQYSIWINSQANYGLGYITMYIMYWQSICHNDVRLGIRVQQAGINWEHWNQSNLIIITTMAPSSWGKMKLSLFHNWWLYSQGCLHANTKQDDTVKLGLHEAISLSRRYLCWGNIMAKVRQWLHH